MRPLLARFFPSLFACANLSTKFPGKIPSASSDVLRQKAPDSQASHTTADRGRVIMMQSFQGRAGVENEQQERIKSDGIRVCRGFDTTSEHASDRLSESELIPHGGYWFSTAAGRLGTATVDVEGAYQGRKSMR
ncbi:hypothetical protein DL764_008052 [Monosporascus ibericus]|uniref:Uncharacterized protein n=1 Tax=Monosporascus ibericus TaxID=155417 RepID=A0A4Q4SYJ6_9PEZI|nr:hypothetical protein DL764_008052 [Monosporascus ibericus]